MQSHGKKTAIHIIVLYVLIIIFGGAILALNVGEMTSEDNWQCVQEQCVEFVPGGQEWAAQNCGVVEDDQGNPVEACRVVVNGVEQVVPANTINFSAIQTCAQSVCLQEVRVRAVNKTITP